MKSFLFTVFITILSSTVWAGEWNGATQWYRITATSDNQGDHKFKIEEIKEGKSIHGDTSCQFFLFLCGYEERFQDMQKLCKKAWKNYKPVEDVEFGGQSSPTEIGSHDDGKTISRLVFNEGLEYGSLKSFKIDLRFDRQGKLNSTASKIFFRELIASKPSEDDSAFKRIAFGDNAAYFEIGAKCPVPEKKDKEKAKVKK